MKAGAATGLRRRRWVHLAIGLLGGALVVGAAGWWGTWALGTCRPLDRLLGRSGCVASHRVDGFHPLLWETVTVPPDGRMVSLFGTTRTVDGWRTAMATLDIGTGEELGRHPIPALYEPLQIRVAPDRRRVGVFCEFGAPCMEGGHQAVIVSAEDGRALEFLTGANPYRHQVPGSPDHPDFPALPDWTSYGAALMPGGGQVAEQDEETGDIVLRAIPDGEEIRRLRSAGWVPARSSGVALAPSPSGRRLAAVFNTDLLIARVDRGSVIHVWDTGSGEEIALFELDHHVSRTLAWTPGEDRILTVGRSRDRQATWVDVYALPSTERPVDR